MRAEQVVDLLAAHPDRILTATRDVAPALLRTRPQPDAWSANEVLAHLRSCADVWGGCIDEILGEDRPTIRAVNPRAHITRTDYLDLAFAPSLHCFVAQREELLSTLRRLSPDQWSRTATVTGAGRPIQRTVLSYAEWLATHERPHVKQIERAVAALPDDPALQPHRPRADVPTHGCVGSGDHVERHIDGRT